MSVTVGKIFDAVSMAANATSESVSMVERLSITIILESAAGTRAGAFAIQGKLGESSWVTTSFYNSSGVVVNSIAVTAGVATLDEIHLGGRNYDLLRVVFTDSTSGTGVGVLNGWVDRGE